MIDASTIIEYTHDEFKAGIATIANSVLDSEWYPDYIVGIVRGGAIPAVYLSHRLKVPVRMVHWNTRDASHWENESNKVIPGQIQRGAKILIVDDIIDGGDTIKELLEDWNNTVGGDLNMSNIKIATLWYNASQSIKCDFYHKIIYRENDSRWIIYDWEA